jgi:hypothetical protein
MWRRPPATFIGTTLFRPSPEGIAAGTFGTAMPIATTARWLAEGRIAPGVHPPETAMDADAFIRELSAKGVEASTRLESRFA